MNREIILNYRISDAEPKDLDRIAQLYYQNHISVYRGLLPDEYISGLTLNACRAKWAFFISCSGNRIWIACQDKEFLGFAACMPDPKLPRTWYLDSLHVTEGARGRGIGADLIRTAGAFALRGGYEKMSVCIVRGNDRAGCLYAKLGAEHYEFFEDSFQGVPSNSEKLIWNSIPH